MSANSHGGTPYYFVPGPSRHPAMAALGLFFVILGACLLYTSPSPRDRTRSRMPSSA